MANKGLFMGVNGVAKKGKNLYIGVNGVAKKIKKIYVGDKNGIARTVHTDIVNLDTVKDPNTGETLLLTPITMIWSARDGLTANTTDSGYALFLGGTGRDNAISYSDEMDVYSPSLTKTALNGTTGPYAYRATAKINGHVLLIGGNGRTDTGAVDFASFVHAVDNSLTASRPIGLIYPYCTRAAATAISDDLVYYAGGVASYKELSLIDPTSVNNSIRTIDKSLTSGYLTDVYLDEATYNLGAASIKNHSAFFAGGRKDYSNHSTMACAINMSGTKTSLSLSYTKIDPVISAQNNDYVMFAADYRKVLEVFDRSYTRTLVELSGDRYHAGTVNHNGIVYFAGGTSSASGGGTKTNTIESFDENLVRTLEPVTLKTAKSHCYLATAGDYIVLTGGRTGENYSTMNNETIAFKQV